MCVLLFTCFNFIFRRMPVSLKGGSRLIKLTLVYKMNSNNFNTYCFLSEIG